MGSGAEVDREDPVPFKRLAAVLRRGREEPQSAAFSFFRVSCVKIILFSFFKKKGASVGLASRSLEKRSEFAA
jgi:hypothetical protein